MPACAVCRKPVYRLYPLSAPSGEAPPLVCRRCFRKATGASPENCRLRHVEASEPRP